MRTRTAVFKYLLYNANPRGVVLPVRVRPPGPPSAFPRGSAFFPSSVPVRAIEIYFRSIYRSHFLRHDTRERSVLVVLFSRCDGTEEKKNERERERDFRPRGYLRCTSDLFRERSSTTRNDGGDASVNREERNAEIAPGTSINLFDRELSFA